MPTLVVGMLWIYLRFTHAHVSVGMAPVFLEVFYRLFPPTLNAPTNSRKAVA